MEQADNTQMHTRTYPINMMNISIIYVNGFVINSFILHHQSLPAFPYWAPALGSSMRLLSSPVKA